MSFTVWAMMEAYADVKQFFQNNIKLCLCLTFQAGTSPIVAAIELLIVYNNNIFSLREIRLWDFQP